MSAVEEEPNVVAFIDADFRSDMPETIRGFTVTVVGSEKDLKTQTFSTLEKARDYAADVADTTHDLPSVERYRSELYRRSNSNH
ncbi:hypothetical protein [Oryzifoliimicrobium ureilyticus]|uniref:hypothetical protein n=1 Tax=Oryzifoliimicrobium ureilyticus TaxID=3113724 RepID=UPI0030765793